MLSIKKEYALVLFMVTVIALAIIFKSPLIWIIIINSIILFIISIYKKLYGYILREHILPFTLSIFVMIFILLAQFLINNIDKFLGKGLGIGVLFEMVYYNMAWVIALAIPMAILVCTLMAFGRLSSDNEITAMKSSGVRFSSLIIPPIIFAALIAIVMIYFNNWVLPDMNYKARNLISNISKKNPDIIFEPNQLHNELDGHIIHFKSKDEDKFKDCFIIEHDSRNILKTITSKYAKIIDTPDEDITILLENGYVYENLNNKKNEYRIIKFDENVIKIAADNFSFQRRDTKHRGDRELTFNSIKTKITSFNKKIINANQRINDRVTMIYPQIQNISPEKALKLIKTKIDSIQKTSKKSIQTYKNIERGIRHDKSQIESNVKLTNKYLVELHKKFSIPIACIVFILIGAPLGIITKKGKFSISMAMSLIFFLIYWVFLIAGENFADKGKIDPVLSMWLPNIVLLVVGIYLNIKINKEQDTFKMPNFYFWKNK